MTGVPHAWDSTIGTPKPSPIVTDESTSIEEYSAAITVSA
jgi:hypothetical protein